MKKKVFVSIEWASLVGLISKKWKGCTAFKKGSHSVARLLQFMYLD